MCVCVNSLKLKIICFNAEAKTDKHHHHHLHQNHETQMDGQTDGQVLQVTSEITLIHQQVIDCIMLFIEYTQQI